MEERGEARRRHGLHRCSYHTPRQWRHKAELRVRGMDHRRLTNTQCTLLGLLLSPLIFTRCWRHRYVLRKDDGCRDLGYGAAILTSKLYVPSPFFAYLISKRLPSNTVRQAHYSYMLSMNSSGKHGNLPSVSIQATICHWFIAGYWATRPHFPTQLSLVEYGTRPEAVVDMIGRQATT